MTTVETDTREVFLAGDCVRAECLQFAAQTYAQLSRGYTRRVSVMAIPDTIDEYLASHRTARKRAARARRLDYRFGEIDRPTHADDIFDINTSTPERQGRPMSAGYLARPTFGDNPKTCDHHHVYTYGVTRSGVLFAYLWLYRVGDLAMISSILGHADRLADDIMYLLAVDTIAAQLDLGGLLFYNLHSSGTDGLRYFKERIGLHPEDVTWKL